MAPDKNPRPSGLYATRTMTGAVDGVVKSPARSARPVVQVLADPSRFRNQEVTLFGTVQDSFSVMNLGAYRLDDRTGSLWVVSDHGVPRRGARASVTGTIREAFNLGALASQLPSGARSGVVLVDRMHSVR